jgi:hypothetical protein
MRRLRICWLVSSSLVVFLSVVFQPAAADLTITVRDLLHDPRGRASASMANSSSIPHLGS